MDCPDGFAATVPGDGNFLKRGRLHDGGYHQDWATASQDDRVSDRQRMAFSRALSLMPWTASPAASNQHAVAKFRVASSLKIVAASRASKANSEEIPTATSTTRLGLYRGGKFAGGVTCSPVSRAPMRAARATAKCTRRRPAWPPSTCTSKSRNMSNLQTVLPSDLGRGGGRHPG